MAVNPHPWTDDDGSGTTGTALNNTALGVIYNDLGPTTSTITTTGNQTALATPGALNSVIFANNASLLTLQGIAAGYDGQRLVLFSIGTGQVNLSHQDASAPAANRLVNTATVGATSLAAGSGYAIYVYDGTAGRWRLVCHEQGAWITPTYAAGNFTGNGAMTWTVQAGDVTTYAYLLRGRMLTVNFTLVTTTVGGTLNSQLLIALPGGYSAPKDTRVPFLRSDNGVVGVGEIIANAVSGTLLALRKDAYAANAWAAATDTTAVQGSITVEVS